MGKKSNFPTLFSKASRERRARERKEKENRIVLENIKKMFKSKEFNIPLAQLKKMGIEERLQRLEKLTKPFEKLEKKKWNILIN